MSRARATAGSAVTAAVAAIVTVVVVIFLTADAPYRTLSTVLIGPWANRYALGNLLSRASMLMLTGAGVVVAFRAGVFNLGGEGQVYAAAVLVTVLLTTTQLPTWIAVAVAIGGGAGIAGLSGWLKHRTGADELITSFLLSAALFPVLDYLLTGPLRDPDSSLLASRSVPDAARLTRLLPPSALNAGVFWGLFVLVTLWIALRWTLFGYELRIVGYNRRLARYAGMPVGLYTALPMALSGLMHGAAGVILVLGVHHRSIAGFSGGLGWNGIAVALIARNHPLLLIPAAIFFAFLESGARAAVLQNQTTWELGSIVQAVVFLFVTADIAVRRRRRLTRRSSAEEESR